MAKLLVIESDFTFWNEIRADIEPQHLLDLRSYRKDLRGHLLKENYDVVLLSFDLAEPDGFHVLEQIRQTSPHTPVIAVSEFEYADLIIRTMKEGVFDFIVKPFSPEKLLLSLRRCMEDRNLKREIDCLRHSQEYIYDFSQIIAASPAMRQVIDTLKRFSKTDSTILITGETGTGKSFLSGAVHYNSVRKENPFVKINCANLPETLLESELFGHEKGAFTGAEKTRVGRLEQAAGGTVFLDEISELSASLQAKMLRVLEEKSFERVGGNRTIHTDVRIIAATNCNPEKEVASGAFREDLYYRLNVLRVHLPPLRERRECIAPLSKFLLSRVCRELRKKFEGFTPEAFDAFERFAWPGNIRQLGNTIERAAILEDGPLIGPEHLITPDINLCLKQEGSDDGEGRPEPQRDLSKQEMQSILQALEECLWIQKDAARKLGLSPRVLNYKIKKFGITHPRWRKNKKVGR